MRRALLLLMLGSVPGGYVNLNGVRRYADADSPTIT